MSHLSVLIIPFGITVLDGNDTALYVMDIVTILLKSHTYDSEVYLTVNTLGFQSFLQG